MLTVALSAGALVVVGCGSDPDPGEDGGVETPDAGHDATTDATTPDGSGDATIPTDGGRDTGADAKADAKNDSSTSDARPDSPTTGDGGDGAVVADSGQDAAGGEDAGTDAGEEPDADAGPPTFCQRLTMPMSSVEDDFEFYWANFFVAEASEKVNWCQISGRYSAMGSSILHFRSCMKKFLADALGCPGASYANATSDYGSPPPTCGTSTIFPIGSFNVTADDYAVALQALRRALDQGVFPTPLTATDRAEAIAAIQASPWRLQTITNPASGHPESECSDAGTDGGP